MYNSMTRIRRPTSLQFWKLIGVSHLAECPPSQWFRAKFPLSTGVSLPLSSSQVRCDKRLCEQPKSVYQGCVCSSIKCIELVIGFAMSEVQENDPHAAVNCKFIIIRSYLQ
ncbi:hypothetical protein CY34DRAFT_534766 [Suillus luteus UH-Slu-Lm8-n1]|uniref:Unplaced genomic scaffold CY34scaffold_42, whole genome shotgun sequence n=1 Tax=Suillus luteus UH-Slu-Lm8-n1 TaxID=930992 RepID=A0A0D0BH09_9AGAM|nr:hypothetical protein CY34DRAFT_534766 [Suillus luteus UH-Slu-Lm8-n1]